MTPASTLRFDHIGVVVPDLALGRAFFADTLGILRWTEIFVDPGLGVSVQFGVAPFDATESTDPAAFGPAYELITPLGDASPVAAALRSGQRILNHIAYLTPDLEAAGQHLAAQGCCAAAPPHPAVAYAGRRVQFWVSPLRFLIELIEAPNHQHHYVSPPPQDLSS